MHQASFVVDNCSKYEQNQPILFAISQQTHMFYIAIITQNVAQSQMLLYVDQQNMVHDYCMNKINPFF